MVVPDRTDVRYSEGAIEGSRLTSELFESCMQPGGGVGAEDDTSSQVTP